MTAPMNSIDLTSESSSFISKASTPDITPSSTPGLRSEDGTDTCKIGARPLPAFQREFPKPSQDVDVKAMLERQPGRWTIQGQIAANQQRAKTHPASEEALKEQRARDFENAKKDLLALQDGFHPPS